MNGGTIEAETTNNKSGCGVFANTTATATINGGTIRVHAAATGYAVNVAGTTTITGGKFYATGTGATACVVNTGTLTLQGGYYNSATNLATYISSPYEVQETTAADKASVGEDYTHKVVEIADVGSWLDIVDVDNTNSKLIVNVTSWPVNGWPYSINRETYAKDAREDDRTLKIPYTGAPGDNFVIAVQKNGGAWLSNHTYVIPQEITSNTTIAANQTKSLYV
jgi:hypothetical protein